jgi:glycosyltransferase involved in cell wall biosynthesis
MNKGINAATGDYLLFIHSDDYLESPTVIASVVEQLSPQDQIRLFYVMLNLEKRIKNKSQISMLENQF